MERLILEVPRWSEPGLKVGAALARLPAWLAFVLYAVALWLTREVAYGVLAKVGVAPLWLPAGVVLFALLVVPARYWLALAIASFTVGVASAVEHGRAPGLSIALEATAALQAVAGAWLVRLATPRVSARSLRGVTALVLGPAIATVGSAVGWRTFEAIAGWEVDPTVDVFWLGSILGVATLGWLLVAWAEESPPEERTGPALAETVLALGALGGAIAAMQLENSVFATEILLFPPVIWLAVRFGPRGGAAGVFIGALGTVYTVWTGNVVIGLVYLDPIRSAMAVQLFIAVLCTPTAFVTAVVAERRVAEEGRVLLARAMDQSADGLGVFAEDGTILWVNNAAARFYGMPARDLVGRRAWALFPGGSLEKWERRWSELVREGVTVREDRTRLPDGRVTPWELSTALVQAGRRRLAVSAIRDVTDRQRAAEALRLAGIGTLAAGVAHEINNPLASVVGNLALVRERLAAIRERGSAPELARFAEEWLPPIVDAEDGARRVREIVAELRVFARAEAVPGPVDVGRAMRSALSLAQSEIQHRARLVTRIAAVPPVFGSEGRLAQAFANVLVNAARAIPEGGSQENEIRVEVRLRDGEVVAEVADTGVGMSQEVRARIFEPFFTTRDIGEGSGLGLAVTHAIVTAMRGRIDVDSAPGAGTRFRISLPAEKGIEPLPPAPVPAMPPAPSPSAPAPAAQAVPPASPAPPSPGAPAVAHAERAAQPPAAPGARLKILVVDDEPLVARSLQRILSREHEVDVADRARTALDRIASGERFDAVLCDLMMPDVSGMAFHDEVGILDPGLRERVVFVTGGAFTDAARDFLDRVPNLRLEKPVDPTTLRETVRGFTPRPPR
jgi:PAS domain S-box-containing protein